MFVNFVFVLLLIRRAFGPGRVRPGLAWNGKSVNEDRYEFTSCALAASFWGLVVT